VAGRGAWCVGRAAARGVDPHGVEEAEPDGRLVGRRDVVRARGRHRARVGDRARRRAGRRGVKVTGVVDNNVWPPRLGVTVRTWNLYRGLARQPGVTRVTLVSALKSRERADADETREGVRIVRVKPWHPTLFAWLD